jgi:hypothetical protein
VGIVSCEYYQVLVLVLPEVEIHLEDRRGCLVPCHVTIANSLFSPDSELNNLSLS